MNLRRLPVVPVDGCAGQAAAGRWLQGPGGSPDSTRSRAGVVVAAGAAVLTGLLFAAVLAVLSGHRTLVLVVDDSGQLLAAAGAAAACAVAARRSAGASRRSWGLLAVGVACWAGGQAVWSVYEVGLGREVPFPSAADVGFLLFPVVASVGLLGWLGGGDRVVARARDLLDGVVIAGSLLTLSWVTTLGSVVDAGGPSHVALVLSLAYPVGDVVMATVVLLTLVRALPGHRDVQLLLAAGLGGLAVADSAYVYLVTAGTYSSGNLISAGWLTGFLLIAAAAQTSMTRSTQELAVRVPPAQVTSWAGTLLPYAPLLVAEAIVVARVHRVPDMPLVDLWLGVGLIGLVLARQLLALTENRSLLVELAAARDELRHQSLHDPLTGLANRVLFTDRLEHALAVRHEDGAGGGVAVLFCDLDDFKTVNDVLGHSTGDEVLRLVAARFREVLRPGDTVARLGGDEFAVLLEGSDEPVQVAQRLVAAVARPGRIEHHPIQVSLSVGIALAEARSASTETRVRDLMRQADTAMYAAKAGGKGQAVVFDDVEDSWQHPLGQRPAPAEAPGTAVVLPA